MSALGSWGSLPAWTRSGLWAGFITSVHLPVGILVVEQGTGFWPAYPLLLLPLLLTGPVAVGRLRLRAAIQAALLGGTVAGIVAAGAFAAAWAATGAWYWMLTSAAGAPPMPPLPRITVLPFPWLSWAHQDILFFEPPLAVVLGLASRVVRPLGAQVWQACGRVLPRSIGGQLRLAFGTVTLLSLLLGAVAFGTIEEMHLRTHRIQIRTDWQRQLGAIRALLDDELRTRTVALTASDVQGAILRSEQIARVYGVLGMAGQRPGLSARPEDLAAALATYREAYERATAAHQRYDTALRSLDATPSLVTQVLFDELGALDALQQRVGEDLAQVMSQNDLTHHERLIGIMALVGLVAALGLWTGERVLEEVGTPLAMLGRQVRRVARGDFSRRVAAQGPHELRLLGQSVNAMTADLDRLYEAERERRATAEALAMHERDLSDAKEFWTHTLVHDLKNPLALIVGWTDLLEHTSSGRLPPASEQALQQIQHAATMLNGLVADINDSFRLQANSLPVHLEAAAPGRLLQSVADEYAGLGRPAPEVAVGAGVGPVLADVRLVGRVLSNLIGNAYKHGGADVRVVLGAELVAGSDGQGGVCIVVDDAGRPIPERERERVFERFAQGTGAAQGSGLGLTFCRLVVEQLGGRIWADASPLGGTRIAFVLPAAPAERAPLEMSPAVGSPTASRVA